MSDDSSPANGGAIGDGAIPWILRQAAERRSDAPVANGFAAHAASAATADDGTAEAPISKFRRVSGGQTLPGAAPALGRAPAPAPAPARTYTPPPPPPPMEWESNADTFRPQAASAPEPAWRPPPPNRPSASSDSPRSYLPPPRRRMSGGVIAAIVAGALVLGGGGIGVVLLAANGGPSRADFVADADDICRPANGPVAAIVKPTNYPELATAAGTLTGTIDSQVVQLRALDQPRGAAGSQVTGTIAALEGTSAAAKRLQDAAGREDDAATIAATKDVAGQATAARTKATTTGFAACSVGMQTGVDAVFGGSHGIIKSGFIAESDILCRRAADDIFEAEIDFADEQQAFIAFIGNAMDVFDQLVVDIRALPVAPGDEATVSEILTAQDKVQAKGREFEDAAGDDDFDRLDALDRELVTLTTAADAKWDAYGLGSCGSNFGF